MNSTRRHAHGKLPTSIPDYTTINRRINRLNIKVEDNSRYLEKLFILLEYKSINIEYSQYWSKFRYKKRNRMKILIPSAFLFSIYGWAIS